MQVDFTKMQSLGNDFVVLDGVSRSLPLSPDQARRIADRHFGIGCDQVLLAEAGQGADFRFRIFNHDGGEVEQCGNGARCFARFLRDRGLTDRDAISVETLSSRMLLRILPDGNVSVDMGPAVFAPARIPFDAEREADLYSLTVDGDNLEISALSMGNPHAVLMVTDVDTAPVERLGPVIESHPRFPARVNVGFCQVVARNHVRLRVFERGVGETLGCGSGACAAVVAGIRLGLLDAEVLVSLPGGDARVAWAGGDASVLLSGPAITVFNGVISLPPDTASGIPN